jgi:hypothetical protein
VAAIMAAIGRGQSRLNMAASSRWRIRLAIVTDVSLAA